MAGCKKTYLKGEKVGHVEDGHHNAGYNRENGGEALCDERSAGTTGRSPNREHSNLGQRDLEIQVIGEFVSNWWPKRTVIQMLAAWKITDACAWNIMNRAQP